eukprot:comp21486_c0_seq1/m.29759 comp21486_c0_seq1/g.29759  ORF comp21486_c0_seq1/g.29759 comp21486_c0_seq1/m.29759 type:complete len:114 (-) comp21486_c0_seq1:124-465(-)
MATCLRRSLVLVRALPIRAAPAAKGAPAAKKKAGKDAGGGKPTVVANFNPAVCNGANIYVGGEDPPLRPNEEYPDWLWTLLDEPKITDPLDKRYWRKLRKTSIRKANQLTARK